MRRESKNEKDIKMRRESKNEKKMKNEKGIKKSLPDYIRK